MGRADGHPTLTLRPGAGILVFFFCALTFCLGLGLAYVTGTLHDSDVFVDTGILYAVPLVFPAAAYLVWRLYLLLAGTQDFVIAPEGVRVGPRGHVPWARIDRAAFFVAHPSTVQKNAHMTLGIRVDYTATPEIIATLPAPLRWRHRHRAGGTLEIINRRYRTDLNAVMTAIFVHAAEAGITLPVGQDPGGPA